MKCIIKDCPNHSGEGVFHNDICLPCYEMLVTGNVKFGETFIHQMRDELRLLEQKEP